VLCQEVRTAPLLALGISVLPALARLVAGERAGQVAATVTEAVREAAGTDDPATARERLEADPAAASALRVRLAEIALEAERLGAEAEERRRGAELEALRARIAEVRDARGTMAALAGAGSALSWGPATVSAIVTTGFFAMLALFLFWAPAAEHQQAYALLNVAVGALVAGFTAVVNFWIGSSQGSRDKDETVRRLAGQQATLVGETLGWAQSAAVPRAAAAAAARGTAAAPTPAAAQPEDARFGRCLSIVLEREGGYSNDPQHPGGPTMMGITQATLARWRGEAVTAEDVRALTEEEAREIYRAGYWNPLRCDALPPGLDLMVFDFGVNAGPGASARLLQRALAVRADGAIGPITLAAARAAGARACIDRLARLREEHYRALPGFARFGRGWLNRTDHVRRAAAEMAAAVAVTA
jgi:hypothetical protein